MREGCAWFTLFAILLIGAGWWYATGGGLVLGAIVGTYGILLMLAYTNRPRHD